MDTKAMGLELVASFDDPQASYSFDEFCIWRETATGRLFYGQDSGCSCPSPFENVHSVADLTPITSDPASFNAFRAAFESYAKHDVYAGSYRYVDGAEVTKTLDKVRDILAGREAQTGLA